jgi:hypothetical protein
MKHTPGPWERSAGTEILADGPEGELISIALMNVRVSNWEANARLIAAAPDLLAACKAELEVYDAMDQTTFRPKTLARIAGLRAAIVKACGE